MLHYLLSLFNFLYYLLKNVIGLFRFIAIYSPYYDLDDENDLNTKKHDLVTLPRYEIFKKEIEEPFYYTYRNKGKEIRKYLLQYAQFLIGSNSNAKYISEDIEKLHNCSLIIDDIQDNSELRRGRACAYRKFGMPLTLSSSYLIVFEVLNKISLNYSNPLPHLQIIQEEIYNLHYGQSLDIYWKQQHIIPEIDDFIQMIDGKTGSVFRGLIRMCGIENNCNYLQDACQLFIHLARFFQIRDDYINITLPEYWKKKGFCEDFDERKISYLLVLNKTVTGETLEEFFNISENDKLSDRQKITLYSKLYNHNILQKTYDILSDMKKNIYILEQKIRNPVSPSPYLKSFFQKLSYCPPISIDNLIKYLN